MVEASPPERPPRVLVVVGSSGDYPYLAIERDAQQPTFGSIRLPNLQVVWIEGDPNLAKRAGFRLLNTLLGLIHRNIYGPLVRFQLGLFSVSLSGEGWRRLDETKSCFSLRLNVTPIMNFFYRGCGRWNIFSRILRRLLGTVSGPNFLLEKNRVRLNFPNSYYLTPYRTFLRYQHVLETYDFDIVLFTTSTCYVDVLRLSQVSQSLPSRGLYAGECLKLGGPFVSGNSMLLSRDVLENVVGHARFYRLDLPDDVALGRLIHEFQLADLLHIPTQTLPFGAQIPSSLGADWADSYLFRCKAEQRTKNPRPVVSTMFQLHDYIMSTRTGP